MDGVVEGENVVDLETVVFLDVREEFENVEKKRVG